MLLSSGDVQTQDAADARAAMQPGERTVLLHTLTCIMGDSGFVDKTKFWKLRLAGVNRQKKARAQARQEQVQ